MSLFQKKRKEEALRPLSEKDIQQKLYGRLRTQSQAEQSAVQEAEPIVDLFTPQINAEPVVKHAEKPEIVRIPKPKTDWAAEIRNYGKKINVQFQMPRFSMPAFPKMPAVELPKISMRMPAMPRIQKPSWISKLEKIPLSMIAAAFFGIVLTLVVFRGIVQTVLNITPQAPKITFKAPAPEPVKEVPPAPAAEAPSAKEVIIPAKPVAPAAAKPAAKSAVSGKKFYTIQTVVYEDPIQAQKILASLKARNLNAFVRPTKTSRGKDLYQVFLGRFKNYEEAQTELTKYRKLNVLGEFPDSFVRPQME